MTPLFQYAATTVFGGLLTSFGVWVHHALYIKPNQLKIKANIPPALKATLQAEVDKLVPVLATKAEQVATSAVTGLAETVINKL